MNEKIKIEDAKALKDKAAKDIADIIQRLSFDTQCKIESIGISYVKYSIGDDQISVNIKMYI